MLLEHEKDGTGSKRMARASAFLEAASVLDVMVQNGVAYMTKSARVALLKAADKMRDKAVEERKAHDANSQGVKGTGLVRASASELER